ncbi:MAG: (d)CMP kinase [Crocinitomicaceae bacterium]
MEEHKKITIAIDGHSSCGKSTLAKDLAKTIGYTFVDSGAMYRAVTLYAVNNSMIEAGIVNETALYKSLPNIEIHFENINGTQHVFLNQIDVTKEIRLPNVSNNVSLVAKLSEVRTKLVEQQQKMGETGGIIMDGRDIGTVVFPNAELKLFVTASTDVRTERRFKELQEKGVAITREDVKKNLIERDHIDSTREISPLKQADDAIVLDNSNMTKEEQLNLAIDLVNKRTKILN